LLGFAVRQQLDIDVATALKKLAPRMKVIIFPSRDSAGARAESVKFVI
jgi:hypothetical protein